MKITKILMSVALLFAVACTPDNGDSTKPVNWSDEGVICGEWQLTRWGANQDTEIQVYMAFNEDNTFDLYQRLYSVVWIHYTGTFSLDGTTLSGSYSDGEAWKRNYTVAYASEPRRIRLTNTEDKTDVGIYTEQSIPEHIIDESNDSANVRSVVIERFL